MAVSAPDFAFSYFVLEFCNAVPVAGGIGYGEVFSACLAYMVKLKHYYIRFPAVYAGVGLEVCIYIHTNALFS